jgi:hypothetical protein
LNKFPEKVTEILRREIHFFPIFILIIYTPKLIKHTRRYFEQDEIFIVLCFDKCCLGLMGLFLCFFFIWVRKGFNPKKFFK